MELSSIRQSKCSCGGIVRDVESTQEEDQQGCGRHNHCNASLERDRCNTRFSLALPAPEMEDEE